MAAIATIANVSGTGTVYAVNALGVQRIVKAGDTLEKGETLRTVGDVTVELVMEDGRLLAVNPNQSLRLDENVTQSAQTPTPTDAAITTAATTDTVLDALQSGADLSETLDATAAGGGGGGGGGGSSFVQLGRISEGVSGNQYGFSFTGLGNVPINEGTTALPVTAAAVAPTTTTAPTPTQAPPVTTEAPPDTTEAPPVTTQAPPATTEAPPVTTQAPPATTEAPPVTTEAPPATTEAPPVTTQAPPATTEAPPVTTEAPPATTEAPPVTTQAPPVTTQAPPDTTEGPPATTQAPVNKSPEASDDASNGNVLGQPVKVLVTGNDKDPDGVLDPGSVRILGANGLPVTSLTVGDQGTWSVNTATGEITFSPADGFMGNPSPVSYTVADTLGARSNAATVTVFYGPQLVDDAHQAVEGQAAVTGSVAANDQLAGGTYVAGILEGSRGGSLVLSADGSYRYTPPAALAHTEGAALQETFTYQVRGVDGSLVSAQLVATISDTGPVLTVTNAVGSTNDPHTFTGNWSQQLGVDATVMRAAVNSITVGSEPVDIVSTTFDAVTRTLDVFFENPASTGGVLRAVVTFNPDGTYAVDMAAPQQIVISSAEYAGSVKAEGPTSTYVLSYTDATTGLTETAKVYAAVVNQPLSLVGLNGDAYMSSTVGNMVNASSDGIGMENNVLSSYVDKGRGVNVLTSEKLTFNPDKTADQITLFMKPTGDVGFGTGGAEDVMHITVHGVDGETQELVLDSRALGEIESYVINTPQGWTGGIGSVDVTMGFYTDSRGAVHGSDVKVAFGFAIQDRVVSDLPVKLDLTASLQDSDQSQSSVNFSVESQVGNSFTGTPGSDVITGSALEVSDTFVWKLNDVGSDVIKDFSINPATQGGDVLNVKDLLVGEQSGTLENYLHFAASGSNTVISVHASGAVAPVTQTITLEGVSITALGDSDAAIIAKLLANGNLKTD